MFLLLKKSALLFISVWTVSCDSLPNVSSDISWKKNGYSRSCVKEAIENTEGVVFLRLEVDSREFFEPKNLSESIIYRVKGNERFDEVKIGYTAMYGDYYFYHTADGRLNTKMSNFDKEGFSRAIKKVNENLKKYCPSLEQVDDPEKSKEWFLFQ